MTATNRTGERALLAAATFFLAITASCKLPPSAESPFIAGQVLDEDTKQPIEGAYVLALYKESGGVAFGHSGSRCVRSEGAYTDKDGRFSVPRYVKESKSLPYFGAIKTDYFFAGGWAINATNSREPKENDKNSVHKIYLKKQNAEKPEFRYGEDSCFAPVSREAAGANIEFLKIEKSEYLRFGISVGGADTVQSRIDSLQSTSDRAQP